MDGGSWHLWPRTSNQKLFSRREPLCLAIWPMMFWYLIYMFIVSRFLFFLTQQVLCSPFAARSVAGRDAK
jgi:hypothetical protein